MQVTIFLQLTIFTFLFVGGPLYSQEWKLVKERDGIRVYSGVKGDSKIKAFKAEGEIRTTMEVIYPVLADPKEGDWWDDDVKHVEIIEYIEHQSSKYYLVYGVPWPLSDRDLYVESVIEPDLKNSKVTITTQSMDGIIPEKEGLVRISSYWQQWIAVENDNGSVYLTLEGFTDPGGSVPAWLQNMFTDNTPMKLFENLKEKLE